MRQRGVLRRATWVRGVVLVTALAGPAPAAEDVTWWQPCASARCGAAARPSPSSLQAPLAALAARLGEGGRDDTIGRIYLESAWSDLEEHAKNAVARPAGARCAGSAP